MKNLRSMFFFALTLPLCCFAHMVSHSNETTYVIEQSITSPNKLTVHIDRTIQHSTQLILRNVSMGVTSQVENVLCDGQLIIENKAGVWSIPENCQKLSWEILLLEKESVVKQQSIKTKDFILLSGASSLPRLQDASSEFIKITIPGIKIIYPKPNPTNLIPLPDVAAAPIFILLNPTVIDSKKVKSITLTYFLDNPASISALPNIISHLNGLTWLNTVIPGGEKDFAIAWLGISKKQMTLGGATGNDILLANYPSDGELIYGKAMLLYIALHEAFHQFAIHYTDQPTWVAESLAAYYGARAVQIALPNDPNCNTLMTRFQKDGEQFINGLVNINQKVQKGDRSEYGAFYTKGLAFWVAVDEMLQAKNDNLDNHLTQLFKTKYNADGEPLDMQEKLNISSQAWISLHKRFL